MRFAYADPPYLGQGAKHYGDLHPDAGAYDTHAAHRALVARLVDEYPDGWALSLSSTSLGVILPWCPARARVMAWVKPFASFKANVNPAYAWEPVIVHGGRKGRSAEETVRDWVSAPITLQRGTPGAKPEAFCLWMFRVLGALPGDDLDDLFPGSGAVSTAWEKYQSQPTLMRVPKADQASLL